MPIRGRGKGRSGGGRKQQNKKRGGYSYGEVSDIKDGQYIGKVMRNLGNSRYEVYIMTGIVQAQFRKGHPLRNSFVIVEDTKLGGSRWQIIGLLDSNDVESFKNTPHLPDHVYMGKDTADSKDDIVGVDVNELIVVGEEKDDKVKKIDDDIDLDMLISNLDDSDFNIDFL